MLLCAAVSSCSAVTVKFSKEELIKKLAPVGLFTDIQKSRIILQLGDDKEREATDVALIVKSAFNPGNIDYSNPGYVPPMVAPQTRNAAVEIVLGGKPGALEEVRAKGYLPPALS